MAHYKQPDGLRGIFTLFVIASHWIVHNQVFSGTKGQLVSVIAQIGGIGMYFFFVLSGFLISGILISNRFKAEERGVSKLFVWKNYFIRRTFRIFPIFYATIAVLCVLNIQWFRSVAGWHFSYLSNVYFYKRDAWDLGGHLWSLSAEEQFYLLWPVLMLFAPKRYLKTIIISLLFLAPLFRLTMNYFHPSEFTQLLTPGVFDGFSLGALMAYWNIVESKKGDQRIDKLAHICGIVSFVLILLFFFQPFNLLIWQRFTLVHDVFFRSSIAFAGAYVVYRSVNGLKGFWKPLLENKVVQHLGRISYAMYLFHNFQLYAFDWYKLPLPTHGWYLVIHFALLLTLATLSWYLFEKPINNFKKYFPYIKLAAKPKEVNEKTMLPNVIIIENDKPIVKNH